MSYQVNFRLFIPDCEYWESEQVNKLRGELLEACRKVIEENHILGKTVVMSSGEITFLAK